MKSPMVEEADYIPTEQKKLYGHMHVMKSNAGFYIGTLMWDEQMKFFDNGSRDSIYFNTYKKADDYFDSAIKAIEAGEHWGNFFRSSP